MGGVDHAERRGHIQKERKKKPLATPSLLDGKWRPHETRGGLKPQPNKKVKIFLVKKNKKKCKLGSIPVGIIIINPRVVVTTRWTRINEMD